MPERSRTAAKPTPDPAAPWSWRDTLFVLALTAGVALAYQRVWRAGFVWDDNTHLLNNPVFEPGGLARTWVPGATKLNYWPLTFTTFWLEHQVWGFDPLGYHLVNVCLHILAAVLVWRVLLLLDLPGAAAMLAAGVFALHPVAVEAVAWVTQTKTLLPAVCALLSMLCYWSYERRGGWRLYVLALAAFVLAGLARGMAVTLPVVLLMAAWWRRGRITRRDLGRTLPYVLIGVGMAVLEVAMQQKLARAEVVRGAGPVVRTLTAGWAVWFYLGKLLWPMNLSFVYPRWHVNPGHPLAYLPGVLLLVLLTGAWVRRRTWGRPVLMVLVCYLALLLPALGFVDVYFMKYSFVADHYQYLALVVPLAAAAALVARGARRLTSRAGRWLVGLAAAGVVLLLAALTWAQAGVYHDQPTLWYDVLQKNPGCWLAHSDLARVLVAQGDDAGAAAHFRLALAIRPDQAFLEDSLGTALFRSGHPNQAVPHLERALTTPEHAHDPETYYHLGIALLALGQRERAIEALDRAVGMNLDSNKALKVHVTLSDLLLDLGRTPQAIAHLEQALRLARASHQTAVAADIENALAACRASTPP
jgi:tetratricopeptide (TPR) repeat protein